MPEQNAQNNAGKDPMAPAGAATSPYEAVIFAMDDVVVDASVIQAYQKPKSPEVKVYPSTLSLLHRVRAGGVRTGVVSRNAREIISEAGVSDLFDAQIDNDMDTLPTGERDPAGFLGAARNLGVDPARAAVVDATPAGVQAADRAGFKYVVGVNRRGNRAALEAAGADLVVDGLEQLDLGALREDPMLLVYEGFDPAHETHREALTTVGNGYLATRGSAPESRADGVHYPATYLAGVYNRLVSVVEGEQVEDESLVNAPNWLAFDLRVEGGKWWSEGGLRVVEERRELDLRRAVLTRTVSLVDSKGRGMKIRQRRLVSMARPHLVALETRIIAQDWEGEIEIRAALDGTVENDNVGEFRALEKRHLLALKAENLGSDYLSLVVETNQSHVQIAQVARVTVSGADVTMKTETISPGLVAKHIRLLLRPNVEVIIEKVVAVATSHDRAISSPQLGALAEVKRAGDFATILSEHQRAWSDLWERFAIVTDAPKSTALVINLHVFHLLQALSPHTTELDAGVPARGLHGEGYRGHVFWDELFVFPVLNLRQPDLSHALLDYRWRRLDAARDAARAKGFRGAMFPWQSGSDGREETPVLLFNKRSGHWVPDRSHNQRHVGLAVAYNAWQHFQVTGNVSFLIERGAELIMEIARFFVSILTYDAATDRYDMDGAMGPDEYHDGYPETSEPGLRNNAYTNVFTAWVLRRAVEVVDLLGHHQCGDLFERLEFDLSEREHWEHVSSRLRVPFHDGIISQFEGYGDLKELDWNHYRATYGNIERLDLILESEGDSTNHYKLSKQADVLMLFYLFAPEEIGELFSHLGYQLEQNWIQHTVDYYLERTAHGSTLSRVAHAWALARTDRRKSWEVFREALRADLDDTQGGTTGEGVHLGAIAGTVDLLTRCYTGMTTRDGILFFDPQLPVGLGSLSFEISYCGHRIAIDLTTERLRVYLHACAAKPIRIGLAGVIHEAHPGETLELSILATS